MGTRNLTCVYLDGETKLAQYCQWDGYPTGQGTTVLEFLQFLSDTPDATEKFKGALRDCKGIGTEEIETLVGYPQMYPQLMRDMGADVLRLIYDKGGCPICLSESFAGDSLFCEWAYVIDFDTNQFEVYKGYQKVPNEDRFSKFDTLLGRISKLFLDPFQKIELHREHFYPVKKIAAWSLGELPSLEEFYQKHKKENK